MFQLSPAYGMMPASPWRSHQGRFVVDEGLTELSEHAVHHFQKLVATALGARLDPEADQ